MKESVPAGIESDNAKQGRCPVNMCHRTHDGTCKLRFMSQKTKERKSRKVGVEVGKNAGETCRLPSFFSLLLSTVILSSSLFTPCLPRLPSRQETARSIVKRPVEDKEYKPHSFSLTDCRTFQFNARSPLSVGQYHLGRNINLQQCLQKGRHRKQA
jgi:hypothetical protein